MGDGSGLPRPPVGGHGGKWGGVLGGGCRRAPEEKLLDGAAQLTVEANEASNPAVSVTGLPLAPSPAFSPRVTLLPAAPDTWLYPPSLRTPAAFDP